MSDLFERVTRSETPALVQSMRTGEQGQISNATQQIFLDLANRDFYLSIQVLAESPAVVPPRQVERLEPGQDYTARVTVSLNPFAQKPDDRSINLQQQAIKIDRELVISLVIDAVDHVDAPIKEGRLQVRERQGWLCDFPLKIGSAFSEKSIELCLLQHEVLSYAQPSWAASLTLAVGDQPDSDLQPRASEHRIPFDLQPPPEMAFLYIQEYGHEHIQLSAKSYRQPNKIIPIGTIKKPKITFEEIVSEEEYVRRLIDVSQDISRDEIEDVCIWIQKMVDDSRDFCFVIIDLADSGVPWEMLRVSDTGYLGVSAIVTRLTDVHYRKGDIAHFFESIILVAEPLLALRATMSTTHYLAILLMIL